MKVLESMMLRPNHDKQEMMRYRREVETYGYQSEITLVYPEEE